MTDESGTTTYGYDGLNRLTKATTSDGTVAGWTYDNVGRNERRRRRSALAGAGVMTSQRLAMLSVVLAALLWSTSFAVTKVVLPHVGELSLGAARFLLAAALLLLVCLLRRQSLRASLAQHARTAAAGVIGITIYFTLENFGVALATASDATLIVTSYPVLPMVAEAVLGRARLRALNVVGAAVAVVGVMFVISDHPTDPAPHRFWGIGMLLAGGVAWTAYNLVAAQRSGQPARRLGAVLIAGESVTPTKIAGAVVIIVGVAMNVSSPRRPRTTETPQPRFATKESRQHKGFLSLPARTWVWRRCGDWAGRGWSGHLRSTQQRRIREDEACPPCWLLRMNAISGRCCAGIWSVPASRC